MKRKKDWKIKAKSKMNPKEKLYRIFGRISTISYRDFIERSIAFSGLKINSLNYIGGINLLGFLIFVILVLVSFLNQGSVGVYYLSAGLLLFLLVHFIGYLFFYFKTETRRMKIENSLPDMLYLIAGNLNSGMSPYQALKSSALGEFGPLKEEIEYAIAQTNSGKPLEDSLLAIGKRVKSDMLGRTLRLFVNALKSGARMSSLLQELANDISETKNLKRELVLSTKTYSVFIMFIVIVCAPLLMAISIHLFNVISGIQSSSSIAGDSYGLGFFAGQTTITSGFLVGVSIAMLVVTGILSSMLLGVIREGKMIFGLKYSPIIVVPSVILFFVILYGIVNVI